MTTLNKKKDWVNIFEINVNTDELNIQIQNFQNIFNKSPYLIMNKDTLNCFAELASNEDFISYVDCELDCETNILHAKYNVNHKNNKTSRYTIAVDDDLAFGVVKVR